MHCDLLMVPVNSLHLILVCAHEIFSKVKDRANGYGWKLMTLPHGLKLLVLPIGVEQMLGQKGHVWLQLLHQLLQCPLLSDQRLSVHLM